MYPARTNCISDSVDNVIRRVDELEKRLNEISLLTNNDPAGEPASEEEEDSPIIQPERTSQITADTTSTLPSMDIATDSSGLPAYNDVKSSELVRLRNKIECAKNALFDSMVQSGSCTLKPLPPTIPSPGHDDIFVVWCMSQSRDKYKRALVKIIEELQVQEEKEWMTFILSKAHTQDSDDSLYRKHLRAKIEAAKRAVINYHIKRIAGTSKDSRIPGILPNASSHGVDVDVLVIGCLRTPGFDGFVHNDGSVNYCMDPFDSKIGSLITKLLKKEDEEMERLLQLKASNKEEKH
ncbi:hypothetical protein BGZ80_000879 [Entomortierella chlamydospora]|uniref:Uncharacterized protein n=1 Tax=Entomortierella chlamydospora TaxID=101097 RepID=A0A9P6MRT6_9FUNG|nr:hypothetical protein BGZ79_004407 [Entomortierella chlamydospora]KAG0011165.1 hypothetical protein BGZ80_000879 [Entomortierella chlamydospora]